MNPAQPDHIAAPTSNRLERAYYGDDIASFLGKDSKSILGHLLQTSRFAVQDTQRDAWLAQVEILRRVLPPYCGRGSIYFEYSVPRLGKRIDVLAVIGPVIFILEFKVGERDFTAHALDQVYDYALDLKNFHQTSHGQCVAPIVIATRAPSAAMTASISMSNDHLLAPISSTPDALGDVFRDVLALVEGPDIDIGDWERGRYCPTPTIIEAARALYSGHSVSEISRNDASAVNLSRTTDAIAEIIRVSRLESRKSICFVTGVPGSGKTLVGLNVATQQIDEHKGLHSVFLSGNGPLIAVLREALARDKVRREAERGTRLRMGDARREVRTFIQNVHHFRDEYLVDVNRPPFEHVALFDEAQRAWNRDQTAKFMRQKKGRLSFDQSEPEFLIGCLDRHPDWAVIVCLIGGGQEINTGEAGISEWIESLVRSYRDWHLSISPKLTDSEYAAGQALVQLQGLPNVTFCDELHLSVSMRSFRAEDVSLLVKQILDLEEQQAADTLLRVVDRFPIVMTRDLKQAKTWLREKARGSERYGILVSSQAQRLKPYAIDVKSPMDPVHWFLDGKEDVRSSYYLEDVATEFHVQGLELDWACVTWDADFRFSGRAWESWSFCGDRWNHIRSAQRKAYLLNAYRVLLTRARQGMVIVVPEGDPGDPTRDASFYNPTYQYLARIGIKHL